MVKDIIEKSIYDACGAGEINLEFPEKEEFGDYTTNIALQLWSKYEVQNPKHEKVSNFDIRIPSFKTARDLATAIVKSLKGNKNLLSIVEHIEVAGLGFINFWLKKEIIVDELQRIAKEGEKYGKGDILKGRKLLIEHTSPNTIKTLHVGHVRNNVTGMSIHNILEFAGADVALDAINNDRGIHVMKAVWAYMKYGEGKTPVDVGEKPDHFVDKFYVMGAKEAENPDIKEEMQQLLREWEAGNKEIKVVWRRLRDWTFEGFEKTYKRLGSYHDQEWFESDFYQYGKKVVQEGLKMGVFKKLADGAVLSNLNKYKLPDTIILRKDGTSMYHTQDLYLTKLKREKFKADLYIWDIGPEQELYLKQLFAMCEQLKIGKKSDYFHMRYGSVNLKGGGKMSSRAGNVVSADHLMDEAVGKARKIIEESSTGRGLSEKEKESVSEMIGLAAIKYGFLKLSRDSDLYFDIDESLSMEGNSGPYLQYTVARTNSVLGKVQSSGLKIKSLGRVSPNKEELSLLHFLFRFPEVVGDAAKSYSPNLICNYLFDLAQRYNNFYNQHRIIGSKDQEFRIKLTAACGQVLKNGLNLLGIQTPVRM